MINLEVKEPDRTPKPVDPLKDDVGDKIEANKRNFKDPYDGLKDHRLRRIQLSQEELLSMIYERLGLIGMVLEDIRDGVTK